MPTDPPRASDDSILDTLGLEITAVMAPVSICMLLVVLLVTALAPPSSTPSPVTAANLVYQELPSDSPAHKLGGALLNAAVFVALITAATFLLVLLYYYNFTACLRNYTRFSAFFVLASLGGSIFYSLLRAASIPVDCITFSMLVFNVSTIGVLSLFSNSVPIILRQSYTVAIGVITAAWFTRLPEWTTWTLLLALAAYDLVAVLAPHGPLRLLVDIASSRDDDLPALVYEARPTAPAPAPHASPLPLATFASPASIELQQLNSTSHSVVEIEESQETSPLVPIHPRLMQPDSATSNASDEFEMFDSSRGIRLGLGDFVFYSVLVGRAALYDLMTVYACYLAIISGLGCTLILLAVCRKALPALPISITLGVGFYFLTRLLMEPFVVGASTSLVMF